MVWQYGSKCLVMSCQMFDNMVILFLTRAARMEVEISCPIVTMFGHELKWRFHLLVMVVKIVWQCVEMAVPMIGKRTCQLFSHVLRCWFQLLESVVPIVWRFLSPCSGDVVKTSDDEVQVFRKCRNCSAYFHSLPYYSALLLFMSTDILLKGLFASTWIVLWFSGDLWSLLWNSSIANRDSNCIRLSVFFGGGACVSVFLPGPPPF